MKKILSLLLICCILLSGCGTAYTDIPSSDEESTDVEQSSESSDDSFGGNDSDGTFTIYLESTSENVNNLPLISDGIAMLIEDDDYDGRDNLNPSIIRMMLNQIDGWTAEDVEESFMRDKSNVMAVYDESEVDASIIKMVDDLYENLQFEDTVIDITKYDKHDLYCADWHRTYATDIGDASYKAMNLYVTMWDETICLDAVQSNTTGMWFLSPESYSTWVCRGKSVLEWMLEDKTYDALYYVGGDISSIFTTSDFVSSMLSLISDEFGVENNELYSYEWRGIRSSTGIDYYICRRWDDNDNYFCAMIADGYGWDGCYIPAEYAAMHKDGIDYNYEIGSQDVVTDITDRQETISRFYKYIDSYRK